VQVGDGERGRDGPALQGLHLQQDPFPSSQTMPTILGAEGLQSTAKRTNHDVTPKGKGKGMQTNHLVVPSRSARYPTHSGECRREGHGRWWPLHGFANRVRRTDPAEGNGQERIHGSRSWARGRGVRKRSSRWLAQQFTCGFPFCNRFFYFFLFF